MTLQEIFALSPIMLAFGVHAQLSKTTQNSTSNVKEEDVEVIRIVESRIQRLSSGATGLGLDSYETPQSVSIVEDDTIANYQLDDINSLFEHVTGINIDRTETDRTYFNSRGFDITSMHVDGSGVPFGDIFVGDMDTAIYERVEFIRGSNGLITGLGNPSGTVNYVRKRPENDFAARVDLTYGRWAKMRAVADVSTPLTESGTWAARAVVVHQDKESWLNLYGNNRNVVYGVVDGQISDTVTVTVGYSFHDNNAEGNTWGAVPQIYSDGTQADFPASTTTAMNWTYWDTLNRNAFAEVSWFINDDLNFTSKLNHINYEEQSELFYTYWNTGLDRQTGLGLLGYPGKFSAKDDTLIWDNTLQGNFNTWGREHTFIVGVSLADAQTSDLDSAAMSGFDVMPAFAGWTGNEVSRPEWAAPTEAGFADIKLNRYYTAMQLSVSDRLDLVLGGSFIDYDNEGEAWGASTSTTEDGTSPYLGFTWEAIDNVNFYASYSDIYQPQYYLNEDIEPLGSAYGRSYEAGVKSRFENNFLISLALFRTEQENLYEFLGYDDGDGVDDEDYSDDFTYALYQGITVASNGFEVEVSGPLNDEWSLIGGLTVLNMRGENGSEARTHIPRRTFKLLADYAPQWNEKLNAGVSVRWQSEVYSETTGFGRITQDSYGLVGGYASYTFNQQLSLHVNVDNILDETYLGSVRSEQTFAGSPTDYSVTLRWDF
ncbi:TonB-dependent siderophore receptor [Alteromonas sp. ASW11-130]|uniref:TonB-dependent siderophore receptor n=1 Tax=Alteromonas sp. ASW11-130 TaxID=3015775 RepID=UPI0022428D9A|nr:TonB-dependent siderophore receptor [Alteromonas sp. ASW11-130]MCW8091142.1 TonB-dependent siderophore receptor [Alteromonas sp. ASW11-130]